MFGIAFQYFPTRGMRGVLPGTAIRDAVKGDSLSLIAIGPVMFGWMSLERIALNWNREAIQERVNPLGQAEQSMFSQPERAPVRYVLLPAETPDLTSVVFGFVMQIGMVLGFCTTCPGNALLARAGIKSGM
ncbi:MAG: DUF4396 domain-containing protein [Acetobacteraceae bacterium]